jgi:hypothetical protein
MYSLRPGGDGGGERPVARGLSAGAVGDMLVSEFSVGDDSDAALSAGASTRKASRPALTKDWRPGPALQSVGVEPAEGAEAAAGGVSVLSRSRASSSAWQTIANR